MHTKTCITSLIMLKEGENSNEGVCGDETSQTKLKEHTSKQNLENQGEKIGFPDKGIDFLKNSEIGSDKSMSKFSKNANFSSPELTLSYLCDNSKLNFPEKVVSGKILMNTSEKASYKGKEVMHEDQDQDDNNRWVERDFLQLNGNKGNSSKRVAADKQNGGENREKMPKTETLNLSLALPDVSLPLASLNPAQNTELSARLRSCGSVPSLAPLNNNLQTTNSNDFSAASLSHSFSLPYSHNPSCSLTRNSTENYEYSMGSHRRDCDQIWNCGEGTNGSVHSRFRPLGDGVVMSNHRGGGFRITQGDHQMNKESNNSICRTTTSDNSFFPSELPARPTVDSQSADSRGKGSEHLRGVEGSDGAGARKLSRPERILREIVLESIPVMAQIIQELPDEAVESAKEYLKSLIVMPEKKEELVWLKNQLERRSDLTNVTLSKSHRSQLEILVAIKMGLGSFLFNRINLPTNELVEIFFLERCPNVNCKRLLPVEDCDCKICSTNKGFCSECMCPICLKFDCANNTCSWVGCDVCSHWCHAACGIQRNLIKPGPSLKGPSGTTEMQFHCLACSHASEMFGFVKDVFMSFAKDWNPETMVKELDFIRKIFLGSEDVKGKELHIKVDVMLTKLESKILSPSDVRNCMLQFFNYADGLSHFTPSHVPVKDHTTTQSSIGKDVAAFPSSNYLPVMSSFYNVSSSIGKQEFLPVDICPNDMNASLMSDKMIEDECSVKHSKKLGFDSLESIVQIKEAEARMFQSKADEAQREADQFKQIVRIHSEKLKEEYTEKLDKLYLQEIEERRRKRMEELKILENSQYDYCNLKTRMQAEIASLLERMEVTKQKLV